MDNISAKPLKKVIYRLCCLNNDDSDQNVYPRSPIGFPAIMIETEGKPKLSSVLGDIQADLSIRCSLMGLRQV